MLKRLFALWLAAFCGAIPSLKAENPTMDALVNAAARVEAGQDRSPLRQLEERARAVVGNPKASEELEAALIRLLGQGSTHEAKLFAAQQLAFMASDRAVPALAALLQDDQTASVGCTGLAGIGSAEADAALREALAHSTGKIRLQVINALADRRDSKSVKLFKDLARSNDTGTSEAAIAALGRVADDHACSALLDLRKAQEARIDAVDRALLGAAAKMIESGKRGSAAKVYSTLLAKAESPVTRRAAFIGSLETDRDKGQKRILETLRGSDPSLKQVAIQNIRRLPEGTAMEQLIREMPNCGRNEQAMLIDVLADRSEPEARKAVAGALLGNDPEVRSAAINAISRVGGPEDVPLLAKSLGNQLSPEEVRLVESGLGSLRGGEQTDAALASALESSSPTGKATLLKALAARQGPRANAQLLRYAGHPHPAVSQAAMRALARTARGEDAAPLAERLSRAENEQLRTDARMACERALTQIADHDARFAIVDKELSRAPNSAAQAAILSLTPLCGTDAALQRVQQAGASTDPVLKEAALSAAADWPGMAAWDMLRKVYLENSGVSERITALRGMVRLAEAGNARPDPALIGRYDELLGIARSDADRKLVLGALGGAAHEHALELALKQLERPGARTEAEAAVRRIAESIKTSSPESAKNALSKISGSKS